MKRLILITGLTETLEYFSLQLAREFLVAGREVFLWDMKHPADSVTAFEKLSDPEESVLLTFNFIGLCGEGQFGAGLGNIWDRYGIGKICIMVDSPVYYYRQLSSGMKNLRLVCIDRYHRDFVRKYYPGYGEVLFMPLAGNLPLCSLWKKPGILEEKNLDYFSMGDRIEDACVPGGAGGAPGMYSSEFGGYGEEFERWKKRRVDVLFTGNYVPLESLEPSIRKLGDEYRAFVMDIADEMISSPREPFENVLMRRLEEAFDGASEDEYLQAAYQLIYIDLYVRNVYRGKIVTALADNGIKVFCTGKDWDKAPCRHPENLIHTGDSVVSLQCLQALSQAKLSLNMMPWFKAGAHDRVFSSMLQGCALVSDGSEYMDEILSDVGEKSKSMYARFELGSPDETAKAAAGIAEELLKDPEVAYDIALRGIGYAAKYHTWKNRAEYLMDKMGL